MTTFPQNAAPGNAEPKRARHPLARLVGVVGVLLVAAVVLGSVHNAAAADVQHGISLTKGCVSPTQIGARYSCTYTVRNINDEALDTLTITGLVDVVQAAPKSVSSGNVLSSLQLVFVQGTATTPPHCDGGSGAGTAASPYTGATSWGLNDLIFSRPSRPFAEVETS